MKPYYADDSVTIYRGDCRDVLEDLELEVSLLLTDPPYGQQFAGKGEKTAKANVRGDGARAGVRIFRQALAASTPKMLPGAHAYVFCHWESWPDFYDATSSHLAIKSGLIWHKDRGGSGDTELEYARDYEVALFAVDPNERRPLEGRRDGAVLRGFAPIQSAQRLHPTEKPTTLMQYLVGKSCPPGGLILDPFAGSGPVGVAAKNLGRRAVLIELEEKYCEVAALRLSQNVLQLEGGA